MTSNESSSYATGGGGVSLEHQYAATLLAALLAGRPTTELGDAVEVTAIRLQAADISPVDDIVLEGLGPNGSVVRASVGVRRDPKLNSSDSKSVPLVRAFLHVVTERWDEVSAGRWTLTLAVARNRGAIQQVADLARVARAVPGVTAFEEAVPGEVDADTRKRLTHLRSLVTDAVADEPALEAVGVDELMWRWLSALKVRVLRLEGADVSDRTTVVAELQQSVRGGDVATADALFSRLAELARVYAASGGRVTVGMLRREVGTFPIERLGVHESAWRVMDRLIDRLRDETKSFITADSSTIHIDRGAAAEKLRAALMLAASSGGALLITGEPDVGKSALAVQVADELRSAGVVVVSLSLRDLGDSVLEFESYLGGVSVDELFSGAATGPERLLVVDGCEAVMEGQEQLFAALVTSAVRAGLGVAVVTRADGSRVVREVLERGAATGGRPMTAVEHAVGELSPDERAELTAAVDVLARLNADSRAGWLLGRPGLVDALLKSGASVEPGQLLCEADVFSAVWNNLIRRDEKQPPGSAAPDDREATAIAVARRRLDLQEPATGQALRELRSEGVLRSEVNPALSQGPEFSTDLYRDFALCRLFIRHGWAPLRAAGSPRWPIRAARLACQARLSMEDQAGSWSELMAEFGELASADGVRWGEVPYEALLTLGDGRRALETLWDALVSDGGLQTLLRLAEARYVEGSFGDPYVLAPIVEVAFCGQRNLGRQLKGERDSPREKLAGLVLAWLRGLARAESGPDPLRQRVRDSILEQDPDRRDEFAIEALASLGRDLDERAEAWLREVAQDHPGWLFPAVESLGVIIGLPHVKPGLLLDLCEAYYVELPDPDDKYGSFRDPLDMGIRDFQHGKVFGIGAPQAAWYYGPFFRLLNASPAPTIAFINRMLNHAAQCRVSDNPAGDDSISDELSGVTLQISEATGSRHYVGDAHVWSWYRGTSVGPYSCMSALLALERFADHLFEGLGLPAEHIVDLLLMDCRNLAVPGLLMGFLTRHLDKTEPLLDPLLAEVAVWQLEASRVSGDQSFHTRDSDADKLTGLERRRFSPHETVATMVINARLRGDEERLRQLEQIGDRLVESARRLVEGVADLGDFLATVEGWAAEFRINSYGATEADDGVIIQFERPAEIEAALAPRTEELKTVMALYELQNRYAVKNEHPETWPIEFLHEDIAIARSVVDNGPPDGFLWPENPIVAVAAATIRARVLGGVQINPSDMAWAAEIVLQGAENPQIDDMSIPSTLFYMGADRAAAIAVPLLLLGPCDGLSLDADRVQGALIALASSLFDEVRTAYAKGCAPIWDALCDLDEGGTCRRHQPAWNAAEGSLSDCQLGPWNFKAQRRRPALLEPPYTQTLPTVPTDNLLVNRLRMPVVCMAGASRAACLAEVSEQLSAPLWDAHRRGLDHWWRKGYNHLDHRHHEPIARLFIEDAIRGERRVLDDHLRTFSSNAHALQVFMDTFAKVFTYHDKLRRSLTTMWVPSLATVLDAFDAGADIYADRGSWSDLAISALIPTPQLDVGDTDPDATLARCRGTWASPEEFASLIERWIAVAKGEPRAADTIASLANTAPVEWQVSTGLAWLEAIIDGRPAAFSNRLYLVTGWLRDLRASGAITGPVVSRFHRIVDGLAAGGDHRAVELQRMDE